MVPPSSCSAQPTCTDPVECPECCPDPAPVEGCDYCGGYNSSTPYTANVNVNATTVGSDSINEISVQTQFYCNVSDPHGGPVGYENYQKVCNISYGPNWPAVDGSSVGISWNADFNQRSGTPNCCGNIVNFPSNRNTPTIATDHTLGRDDQCPHHTHKASIGMEQRIPNFKDPRGAQQ